MDAWLGHVIELASVGLFAWVWGHPRRQADGVPAARHGAQVELLVAVLYGWLLETLDLALFGTYHYEPVTWWWVGRVPLYIPLLWAVIIHSSMALADRSGLPGWARPCLDGLLAVLIDLAIDAIAIRLGLWRWTIPLDEGWFGVPAGNLCAWLWVAAWYGGMTRFVRRRIESRGEPRWHRWLVPPVAYAGLFGSLWLVGTSGRLLGLGTPDERLWLFAAHLLVFLAAVGYAQRRLPDALSRPPIPPSLLWNRWLMHGSFLLLLVLTGIWQKTPALIGVSVSALTVEWWAQRWCAMPARPGRRSSL